MPKAALFLEDVCLKSITSLALLDDRRFSSSVYEDQRRV